MTVRRTTRPSVVLLVLLAVVVIGFACIVVAGVAPTGPTRVTPFDDLEDCDAEDYANREADCGFGPADRRRWRTPVSPRATTLPPRTTSAPQPTARVATKGGR